MRRRKLNEREWRFSFLRASVILMCGIGCASDQGRFDLYEENDVFGFGESSDENYSQGIRLAYRAPAESAPVWIQEVLDVFAVSSEPEHRDIEYAFGQSIFTPRDLREPNLILDDRPYAGWLYGGMVRYDTKIDDDAESREDTQISVELDVGVVGPPSLAALTQKKVHEWIDSPDPKGWNHQLDFEPGIILSYQRQSRDLYEKYGWFAFDAVSHFGATAGNIYTFLNFGNTVRLGYNLPRDFGISVLNPALDILREGEPTILSLYGFLGVDARVVARDIFLDGNTFTSSHRVTKVPLVGDLRAGFALNGRNWRFSFTYVFRTEEFKAQEQGHNFGSLNLSFAW